MIEEYITTETPEGFQRIMLMPWGELTKSLEVNFYFVDDEWRESSFVSECEQWGNLTSEINLGTKYRIKNPDYKTQVEIPAGWVECDYMEGQYIRHGNKWIMIRHGEPYGVSVTEHTFIKPATGFENHGADWWDKQPVEVISIAKDGIGPWYKYDIIPDKAEDCWLSSECQMFPSEWPNFDGPWEDSLMVRPDWKS